MKEAIRLRKEGYSYSIIKKRLGVSKSTLSNWLSRIPFVPNKEVIQKTGMARLKSALWKHQQKINSFEKAKKEAMKEVGLLSKRDLFMLGIGLYLGEGEKKYENIKIVNSNPDIIRLAIKWLCTVCKISKENLRALIHLYPDNNVQESLIFWSKTTSLPLSQFYKTTIDARKDKTSKKKGGLPYGTLSVYVVKGNNSKVEVAYLHRKICALIKTCIEQVNS